MSKNYKSTGLELQKCVFPIHDGGEIIGQGFIADSCFITAAHVLNDFPLCKVNFNGKIIELSKYNPLYYGKGDYHDPKILDVLIIRFDGINSPLHLSDYMPQKGETLESYCMHEVTDPTSLNPKCRLSMVPAYPLGKEEGYYLYCNCERFEGSSGSPLLKDDRVVGIMQGGNGFGFCAFLKTKAITHLLK
jgi:hypothetical protein